MRFGKTAEEAKNDPRSSGGGNWMKYPKDGTQTFRVLQEPGTWIWFWEHFNPGGFAFPCTNDRETCPGCTSDNEKMKKASRKAAFNVLEGDFVNVWKVPPTLADKLELRYNRLGTITDREYDITRYKSSGDKYEYDVEAKTPEPINLDKYELKEIEPMLAAAYEEAWGDSAKSRVSLAKAENAEADNALRMKIAKAVDEAEQPEEPPFSQPEVKQDTTTTGEAETEVSEAELRSMGFKDLVLFLEKEKVVVPDRVLGSLEVNEIVDWLLTTQS